MNIKVGVGSQSKPLKLGLLGGNVAKSLSPQIYQYLSDKYQRPLEYKLYSVQEQDLDDFLTIELPKLDGLNITSPYKSIVTQKLLAKGYQKFTELNNCNTVSNGLINTDLFAIEKLIHLAPCDTLIYGSGDVVETLVYHLQKINFKNIAVMTRKQPKIKIDNVKYLNWEKTSKSFEFIVNATPLGNVYHPLPLTQQKIIQNTFDLNYLAGYNQIEELSLNHIYGKSMLIWQALKNFELWTGIHTQNNDFQEVSNAIK